MLYNYRQAHLACAETEESSMHFKRSKEVRQAFGKLGFGLHPEGANETPLSFELGRRYKIVPLLSTKSPGLFAHKTPGIVDAHLILHSVEFTEEGVVLYGGGSAQSDHRVIVAPFAKNLAAVLRPIVPNRMRSSGPMLGAQVTLRHRPETTREQKDDLMLIRGVSLLIAKKLHTLGIMRFSQIARWSESDVARVSQKFKFKGRIERERWIEQAMTLADGGETEFSRRVRNT